MPADPERLKKVLEALAPKKPMGDPGGPKGATEAKGATPSKKVEKKPERHQPNTEGQKAASDTVAVAEGPHDVPKDVSIQDEFVRIELIRGEPLATSEKIAKLSERHKPTSQALQGGLRALESVDWDNPSAEQWKQIQAIVSKMPRVGQLDSPRDQEILREAHQSILSHYFDHKDAYTSQQIELGAVTTTVPYGDAERYQAERQAVEADAERRLHLDTVEDTRQYINEVLSEVSDGPAAELLARKPIQSEQVAQFMQEQFAQGQTFDQAARNLMEEYMSPNQPFAAQDGSEIRRIAATVDMVAPSGERILSIEGGAPTRRTARRPATGGGGREITASMLKGLKGPKKDIDDFRREAEAFNIRARAGGAEADAQVAYFAKAMDETRFVILIDKSPALKAHMETLKAQGREWVKKQNFSKEVERGWSSLYLSYEEMKQSWRSPEAISSMWQDRANSDAKRGVYESEWQDSSKRNYSQLIQYISSADYQRHRIAYIENPENWHEISELSGQRITSLAEAKNHSWYREVDNAEEYQAWRDRMADRIRARGDLNRLQIAIQTDVEMDKIKGLYADFGDAGYPLILNERNGLNLAAFEILKERGASIIYDENGNIRALTAGSLIQLEKDVVNQMWAQRDLYRDRFNEWDGSIGADANGDVLKDARGNVVRRSLEKADIEAAVTEVSFLITATGQRAQIFGKAATPLEMRHQTGNPMAFGGQPAEGKILFAMSPFKWLLDRWALKSDFAALTMRNMFTAESIRAGVDTQWRTRLAHISHGSEEWNRLVKMAFNINDLNDADAVKGAFSTLRFERGAMGNTLKDKLKFASKHFLLRTNLEGAIRTPPETLAQLTKDDLLEQILYREGRRLLDARISGAYHIIDSGWQIGTQRDALKDFGIYTDSNGVLLHEVARLDVGALFDTSADHHSIDHATEHLKHHTFKLMGKFDPIASIDALATKMHDKTFEWFRDNATLLNVFKNADMGEHTIRYDAANPQAFARDTIRAASMRRSMIDTELALTRVRDPGTGRMIETPQAPVDYSKWTGNLNDFSPQERAAILKISAATGDRSLTPEANAKAYLDVMKAASDFALRAPIIDDLASPMYAAYFTTVNKIDPRVKFIDGIKDNNPDHQNTSLMWSNRISAIPGGHGAGGGFARWAGDTQNSVKGLGEHLLALLEAKDTKTFMMHFKPFVDTIAYSGGQEGAKAPVGQTLFYGWSQAVMKDIEFDLAGIGDATTMDISPAQRAGGQGIQPLSRIDIDHLSHDVEAAIGEKFHNRMHNFTAAMEKKYSIATNISVSTPNIKIGRLKIRSRQLFKGRIPHVRLYNLHAFALVGGALLAMGAFGAAKKGWGDSSGGSSEHH